MSTVEGKKSTGDRQVGKGCQYLGWAGKVFCISHRRHWKACWQKEGRHHCALLSLMYLAL
jgi:hypothetical protein